MAIASTVEERVRHWRTMIPANPIGRGYKEFKAAVDLVEELGDLLQGLDVIG